MLLEDDQPPPRHSTHLAIRQPRPRAVQTFLAGILVFLLFLAAPERCLWVPPSGRAVRCFCSSRGTFHHSQPEPSSRVMTITSMIIQREKCYTYRSGSAAGFVECCTLLTFQSRAAIAAAASSSRQGWSCFLLLLSLLLGGVAVVWCVVIVRSR